jgi:hypothetical protein
MERRFGVTGCADGRERCEYIVGMTLLTGQPGMCTGQWKIRGRMIEYGRRPAGSGMTCAAISAKLFFVNIVFRMACIAIPGRAFEDIIYMATGTSHANMRTS